jgi:hypothetical protein
MSVPLWVLESADEFWRASEKPIGFPRDLRGPISLGWPVSIVERPHLRLATVAQWLGENSLDVTIPLADRPLRACLVAHRGMGIAFLDCNDTTNERRFSLAHEMAHFLRDYWAPRRRATLQFGPKISEIFDGLRPLTTNERLHAVIRNVPVGCHVHLMARSVDDRFPSRRIADAEWAADRLAWELLAPAHVVLELALDRESAESRLVAGFGLPAGQASAYARNLFPEVSRDPLVSRFREMFVELSKIDGN